MKTLYQLEWEDKDGNQNSGMCRTSNISNLVRVMGTHGCIVQTYFPAYSVQRPRKDIVRVEPEVRDSVQNIRREEG